MILVGLHVLAILVTLGLVLYADEEGLRYLLGKKRTLDPKLITFLHYGVAIALALVIATGGLLYMRAPSYYLSNPAFIVKMIAVAALIVNSAFIEKFSAHAAQVPFRELSAEKRRAFYVSGAVSAMGWTTAVICGLLIG